MARANSFYSPNILLLQNPHANRPLWNRPQSRGEPIDQLAPIAALLFAACI
jgi:hypothetical protein